MVLAECSRDIVVQCELPIGEDCTSVAILPQGVDIVGHEDDVGAKHALAERIDAFPAEALIADLGHLVDQIDVEIDSQTGGEGEPRPHAGGVGVDRHCKIFTKFGESLHIVDRLPDAGAINPRDERDIFAAGEGTVKGARQ